MTESIATMDGAVIHLDTRLDEELTGEELAARYPDRPAPAPAQPVTVALQPASSETAPVYLAYVAARDARGAAWDALQAAIGQQDPIAPPRAGYEAAVAAADTARTAYVQALKDQIEAGQ